MSDSGRGAAADTGPTQPDPNYDPTTDPTNAAFYSGGNYVAGSEPPWIKAGYPTFDAWAAAVGGQKAADEAYRQAQIAALNKQTNATAGASGASAAASVYATNVNAEIARAKNAADAAHQAGLDALAQGNAEDARRQFAISSAELAKYHQMDIAVRQQDATTAASRLGYDVYSKQADLASNPRNYMKQFFEQRGSPAPPGVEQYGNNVVPFEKFLPHFLSGLGINGVGPSSSAAPSGAAPASAAAPAYADPSAQAGRVQSALGPGVSYASGNLGANGEATSAPTQLGGQHPLLPGQTEDPTFQAFRQNVAQNALGGNVSQEQSMNPKAVGPNGLAIYGKGGVIPEPVIGQGMRSGKTYEFGEKGPEGVVPANMLPNFLKKRGGKTVGAKRAYAVGGIIGDKTAPDIGGDPYAPPPPPPDSGGAMLDPGLTSNYAGPGGYQPDPNVVNQVLNPTPIAPSTNTLTASGPNPIDATNLLNQQAAGPQRTSTQAQPLPYSAPATPAAPLTPLPQPTATTQSTGINPTVAMPSTPPSTTSRIFADQFYAPNGEFLGLGGATPSTPQPTGVFGTNLPTPPPTPAPPPEPNRAPSFQTPTFLSQLQNLAQTPSGLGKNPSFLPEDAAAQNPIVSSLIQNGAFPPFLQRIFAQNAGLAGLGTNVPQQTNLPPGVPLASRIALNQMSPSELAAFQSFISANGLDWNDYLAMVDQASPQGSSALPTSYPKFLQQ